MNRVSSHLSSPVARPDEPFGRASHSRPNDRSAGRACAFGSIFCTNSVRMTPMFTDWKMKSKISVFCQFQHF